MGIQLNQRGPLYPRQSISFGNMPTTPSASRVFNTQASAVDTVRFTGVTQPEKKVSFLPHNGSPIVVVPGLAGPVRSIYRVRNFLKSVGHETVKSVKVPFIATGQDLEKATWYLADMVDDIRIRTARERIQNIKKQVEQGADDTEKVAILREILGLDDSKQAEPLLTGMIHMLFGEDNLGEILDSLKTPNLIEGPKKLTDVPKYVLTNKVNWFNAAFQIPANAWTAYWSVGQGLISWFWGVEIVGVGQILSHLHKPKQKDHHLSENLKYLKNLLLLKCDESYSLQEKHKIVNRLMDRVAPRAILVGHSMGGLTSTKVLQTPMDDASEHETNNISMVMAMGSPLNGVEVEDMASESAMKAMRLAMSVFFPGVLQMERDSAVINKVQSLGAPYDTTGISIGVEGDGLVPLDGTHLPEQAVPNFHNLEISPKDTRFISAMYPNPDIVQTALMENWLRYAASRSEALHGFLQHCIHVDNPEAHIAHDGEVVEELFEEVRDPNRLIRLLEDSNYDGLREHVLDILIARTQGDPERVVRYQPLIPVLEEISGKSLPFTDSPDKKAAHLLSLLQP